MIIKSYKEVYKKVAEEKGIDLDKVTRIADYFWSEINDRIYNIQDREIYVYKFGSFRFRKKKGEGVLKSAKMTEEYIKTYAKNETTKIESLKRWRLKIIKIERMLRHWDRLIEDREKFKRMRDENQSINRDISE